MRTEAIPLELTDRVRVLDGEHAGLKGTVAIREFNKSGPYRLVGVMLRMDNDDVLHLPLRRVARISRHGRVVTCPHCGKQVYDGEPQRDITSYADVEPVVSHAECHLHRDVEFDLRVTHSAS